MSIAPSVYYPFLLRHGQYCNSTPMNEPTASKCNTVRPCFTPVKPPEEITAAHISAMFANSVGASVPVFSVPKVTCMV